MNRIASILIFLIATTANAAMVRFVRAVDGQTIVVDRNGTQVAVRLTGVTVAREHQDEARAFLDKTLAGSWLMVDGGDEANVYRSPDGLFVNREMQQQGYITAGPRPAPICATSLGAA